MNILVEIGKNKNLTEFQKAVYKVVLDIPKGEIRTYKWVAIKIGKPLASRAVGNALNKNPYINRVPCHRVVRSDGSIGGYAKGTHKKKILLKREFVDIIPFQLIKR